MVATASTGNCPAADSADSITASAPSKIAVATSDTSARVGTGLEIMLSSICVATTTGLPARARGAGDLLLDARHLLQRHFHAEIAARHHQRVGEVHDLVEPRHRLRLFDLGHHGGAAARDLLGLGDVLGPLHERQPDPVDAGIERGVEIGAVLRRQRRERDDGVGQAHALAVGELAADLDARDDLLLARLRWRRGGSCRRRAGACARARTPAKISGCGRCTRVASPGAWIGVEREGRAVVEHRRAAGERADAQLRSLQIDQDADRPVVILLDLADRARPARACGRAACGSC